MIHQRETIDELVVQIEELRASKLMLVNNASEQIDYLRSIIKQLSKQLSRRGLNGGQTRK